jgi:beta-phosphoglucomutase-like phosphatase (HAD superfamily)
VKIELVIFDCDGVLVDSEPASNRVFVEELSRLGLSISYQEVCERFIGLSMARCMEIVAGELGRARHSTHFVRDWTPFPGSSMRWTAFRTPSALPRAASWRRCV